MSAYDTLTKGGNLPKWLQKIQQHNEEYNKRILLGRFIRTIVSYHARKRGYSMEHNV